MHADARSLLKKNEQLNASKRLIQEQEDEIMVSANSTYLESDYKFVEKNIAAPFMYIVTDDISYAQNVVRHVIALRNCKKTFRLIGWLLNQCESFVVLDQLVSVATRAYFYRI